MDMIQLGSFFPVVEPDDKGQLHTRMYPTIEMEQDPDRAGHARLKRRQRGSPVRWGMSYVGIGYAGNPFTVAAGVALGQTVAQIQEPGYLGHLVIQGGPAAGTLFLTDLSRGGDRLFSQRFPAGVFDPWAMASLNPILGHFIDTTIQLSLDIFNGGAGPVVFSLGFTLI